MKTFKQYINENLLDKMVAKSNMELGFAFEKSVKEMIGLLRGFYDITEEEALTFLNRHMKTFKWDLEHRGMTVKEIYRDWEFVMYNHFGEDKMRP